MKGLVSLVTGAASGLGRATVNRLKSQGVKGIIAIDRQKFPTEWQSSSTIATIKCDTTSEENVASAMQQCLSKFGRLDVCVNCAGASIAYVLYNPLKHSTHKLETFQELLRLNVLGTFNVIRHAVELMSKNEADENNLRGLIVNTSSIVADGGSRGHVALSAASGAINAMTLPIARDLSVKGIRNNTISIGYVKTPLLEDIPSTVEEYLGQIALSPKRLGKPEEFAHLVESLITNPYVNGSVIRLDAGTRLQL